jgi:hypothetical protein
LDSICSFKFEIVLEFAMSIIFDITDLILIADWFAAKETVNASCTGMGYRALSAEEELAELNRAKKQTIEMEMANSEIVGAAMARDQVMRFEKDGVVATFTKDARGALRVHISGDGTQQELTAIGQQLINKVRQQFAAEKVKRELGEQGFVVVDEYVDNSDKIRISVRKFR